MKYLVTHITALNYFV